MKYREVCRTRAARSSWVAAVPAFVGCAVVSSTATPVFAKTEVIIYAAIQKWLHHTDGLHENDRDQPTTLQATAFGATLGISANRSFDPPVSHRGRRAYVGIDTTLLSSFVRAQRMRLPSNTIRLWFSLWPRGPPASNPERRLYRHAFPRRLWTPEREMKHRNAFGIEPEALRHSERFLLCCEQTPWVGTRSNEVSSSLSSDSVSRYLAWRRQIRVG